MSLDDFLHLDQCDLSIKKASDHLQKCIDTENNLEIVLLDQLRDYKDIAQSLSEKNKFIQMKIISENNQISGWVNEWILAQGETRKAEIMLRQLEGRRDSIKKKISILNERGI